MKWCAPVSMQVHGLHARWISRMEWGSWPAASRPAGIGVSGSGATNCGHGRAQTGKDQQLSTLIGVQTKARTGRLGRKRSPFLVMILTVQSNQRQLLPRARAVGRPRSMDGWTSRATSLSAVPSHSQCHQAGGDGQEHDQRRHNVDRRIDTHSEHSPEKGRQGVAATDREERDDEVVHR